MMQHGLGVWGLPLIGATALLVVIAAAGMVGPAMMNDNESESPAERTLQQMRRLRVKLLANKSETSGAESWYDGQDWPMLHDVWGGAIVLQPTDLDPLLTQEFAAHFQRLVSPGPDGVMQTPNNELIPSKSSRGDDVVLFLYLADEDE